MPLGLDPKLFRAVVTTIVPEASSLDASAWAAVDQVVEALLRDRPETLKRQLRIFLGAIQWLPVFRFGRTFTALDPVKRKRVLAHLQNDPIQVIRVGFWGLRTIVLAGYYGRAGAGPELGYRASTRGWEAFRTAAQ